MGKIQTRKADAGNWINGTYKFDEILSNEVVAVAYDKRPFYSSEATIWIARGMD